MEKLLIYRERLLKFIAARGRYIQSGIRFLSGFILFYAMGRLFGYTDFFASPFFLVMMGIINVFIPTSALSLIFYVVIFLQLAHVSLEVALFFVLAVLLYFLVYQRVFPETRIYLMMAPVFFYFQLPAGIPAILMGTFIYYLATMVSQAVTQLQTGAAHGKIYSLVAARAIDNKELLLYFGIFCLIVVLITAIRRKGAARSWEVSILVGGAAYVILLFAGGYFANSEVSILAQIGMVVVSIVIAIIIQFLYNVIDYTREETFEFEDEEYYYYVRAVPKVSVEEEEFNVTQITAPAHRFSLRRKEHKEQDKEHKKGE